MAVKKAKNRTAQCVKFLVKWSYLMLEWDGNKVTAYNSEGDPRTRRDCMWGTERYYAFQKIETMLRSSRSKRLVVTPRTVY